MVTLRANEILPEFWFDKGQSPREVDWLGIKVQVDAAKKAGIEHVVLLGSMGGTQQSHFMNRAMDNMLNWKRKARRHV